MAGKDKTMRAFVRGALAFGILGIWFALIFHSMRSWLDGGLFFLIPNRVECVLSIAPWLLVGGLIGLFEHFYKERRVQFSLRFLMLVTLLVSLTGAWGALARSRYLDEQQARNAIQEEFYAIGFGSVGFFFPT